LIKIASIVNTIRWKRGSLIRVRERRQFFIVSHNEALTVAAMRVNERKCLDIYYTLTLKVLPQAGRNEETMHRGNCQVM
jgi:hypothetical protein